MEPNELVDRIGHEIDKYRDAKDCDLQSACMAYLEARGMVCLKRHTEAPTEDLNGMFVVFRSIYSDRPDEAVSLRRGHQLSRDFQDFRSFGCEVYAIGPLPASKIGDENGS